MKSAQRFAALMGSAVLSLSAVTILTAAPAAAGTCWDEPTQYTSGGRLAYKICDNFDGKRWVIGTVQDTNSSDRCRQRAEVRISYRDGDGVLRSWYGTFSTSASQKRVTFNTGERRYNRSVYVDLDKLC